MLETGKSEPEKEQEQLAFQNVSKAVNYLINEIAEMRVLLEYIGENRGLFPDETTVLVGFYKSTEHWDWIVRHKLYNVRLGARRGQLNYF